MKVIYDKIYGMKNKIILILVSLITAVALSSCSFFSIETFNAEQNTTTASSSANDSKPYKGGVVRLFSTYPDTLNPLLSKNSYIQDILKNVFDGMVMLDSNQKAKEGLAESWKASSDGLVWTFNIRKDAKFHDGVQVTAYDAEYTILTLQDKKINSIYKVNVENISTAVATSKFVLKMVLKTPDSFTPERMTFPVMPKHYYGADDFKNLSTTANNNPIGSGAFCFNDYSAKNEIIFTQNQNWWKAGMSDYKGLKLPYIKELDVKLYKNGASAVKAIQARNIDVAVINSDECGNYFGRYNLRVNKYQNRRFDCISFNVADNILSDRAVRQAISYAIDKTKIISSVLEGRAISADYPIFSNSWLANTDSIISASSKSKARSVLENAGWRQSYGGGFHKNLNGSYTELRLELLVNSANALRARVADKIASQLNAAGIKTTVRKTSSSSVISALKYKHYDMALVGWEICSVPDLSFAYSSKEIATGFNTAGYNNAIIDAYLNDIKKETNSSKKKNIYSDLFYTLSQEVPYVGLYFYNDGILYSKRLSGDLTPCAWNRLSYLPQWYLSVKESSD